MRLLVLLALLAVSARASDHPSVIIFYADDLGLGDVRCCGGNLTPTPHIDRIAAEGARFTRYYTASPICSASRAGLLTGHFPSRHRITSYLQARKGNAACEQADFLDPSAPALPRVFQEAGYATAHFGKWHLGGGRDVDNAPKFAAYGYDENAGTWESPEPHPDITSGNRIWSPQDKVKRWERTGFFVEKTLDFFERNSGKPCFVNLWPDDPHTPWVPGPGAPKGDSRENLHGVMVELDRQVGQLVDGLKKLGREQNTILIFTSDNGPSPTFESSRTTGRRGSKWSLYEGGVRVPFLIRWPGHIQPGSVDETSVLCSVDLFPSLLKLASVATPEGYQSDGIDASAALLGKPLQRTKPVFWEYGRNPDSFIYPKGRDRSPPLAMLQGDWKLFLNPGDESSECYDLTKDPNESGNTDGAPAGTILQLRGSLKSWKASWPKDPQMKKP